MPADWERIYRIVDVLREIASGHGVTPAAIALAWLLHKPGVTSVILGVRTMEQLRQNLAAADVKLSAEEMAKLDAVSATPVPYPQWMIQQYGADR